MQRRGSPTCSQVVSAQVDLCIVCVCEFSFVSSVVATNAEARGQHVSYMRGIDAFYAQTIVHLRMEKALPETRRAEGALEFAGENY